MPLRSKTWRSLMGIATLVTLSALSFAQKEPPCSPAVSETSPESGDSLAAIARQAKAQKNAKAKKIVTDDDLQSAAGPLPRLTTDGPENSEEVIAAIAEYKKTHTPEQTESVMRRWYEEYDEQLAAAIKGNVGIKALREANIRNGYDLCQQGHDYQKCQSRRMAELRGAQQDEVEIKQNNDVVTRIQHSLMNIRNGLDRIGLQYAWFKIRTTNNIDRF